MTFADKVTGLFARLRALAFCTAMSLSWNSSADGYLPVDELEPGQTYGDYIHYKSITRSAHRYDLISESSFVSKVGSGNAFLYKWSPYTYSETHLDGLFSTDAEAIDTTSSSYQTVDIIVASQLSVFASLTNIESSAILKLFPESVIEKYGYVLGVVDGDLTCAYDMTANSEEYMKKGSFTAWDGKEYVLADGDVETPSYICLNNRGNKAFYEDLMYGKEYVKMKKEELEETEATMQKTNSVTTTETASFTNIVITSYYTNTTVVVDPQFYNINSVLKFKYPKYATEGDWILYSLERSGMLLEPLTVHLITNGHWCANVRWEAKEGGTKSVRVRIPVSDEFNDNAPLEVLVKTLSRRTNTSL